MLLPPGEFNRIIPEPLRVDCESCMMIVAIMFLTLLHGIKQSQKVTSVNDQKNILQAFLLLSQRGRAMLCVRQ